jgi:CheY-like chemotaxis protein
VTYFIRERLRVLVADDNQDAAASLAILLTFWGYEVHVVHDGLSALQAARQFKPQVALLDTSRCLG